MIAGVFIEVAWTLQLQPREEKKSHISIFLIDILIHNLYMLACVCAFIQTSGYFFSIEVIEYPDSQNLGDVPGTALKAARLSDASLRLALPLLFVGLQAAGLNPFIKNVVEELR